MSKKQDKKKKSITKFILTSRNIAGRNELKKKNPCCSSQILLPGGQNIPLPYFTLQNFLSKTFWAFPHGRTQSSLLSIYFFFSCCTFIVDLPNGVLPLSNQSHFLRSFHRQIKSCHLGNSSPKLDSTHFIKNFSLLPPTLMKIPPLCCFPRSEFPPVIVHFPTRCHPSYFVLKHWASPESALEL